MSSWDHLRGVPNLQWTARMAGESRAVRAIRPPETSEIPTCTKSSPNSRVTRPLP